MRQKQADYLASILLKSLVSRIPPEQVEMLPAPELQKMAQIANQKREKLDGQKALLKSLIPPPALNMYLRLRRMLKRKLIVVTLSLSLRSWLLIRRRKWRKSDSIYSSWFIPPTWQGCTLKSLGLMTWKSGPSGHSREGSTQNTSETISPIQMK